MVLEQLAAQRQLDLFYGDESRVCSEGYVPYGWQFPGEDVCVLAQKGYHVNCFGLINRQSQCHWATTTTTITAQFVLTQLETLSCSLVRETVVVLDCARIHTSKLIQERLAFWQSRGLFVFFLPPYSPHLNIAETVWRHLKGGWLQPQDYAHADDLAYATNRCLANFGKQLVITFSPFNAN